MAKSILKENIKQTDGIAKVKKRETKQNKIPGLQLFVNFAKASDSVACCLNAVKNVNHNVKHLRVLTQFHISGDYFGKNNFF